MKRISIIIVGALFCLLHVYGQNDHCRKLVDLLLSNQCFQARDHMKQHKDSIAPYKEILTIYHYKMNDLMNRPDSAAFYLEKVLADDSFFSEENIGFKGFCFNELIRLYTAEQNYSKVMETLEHTEQFIKEIPLSEKSRTEQLKTISNGKQYISQLLKEPTIRLERKQGENDKTVIPLVQQESSPFIIIPIKINGVLLEAILDTGVSGYIFVDKSIAGNWGLKRSSIVQDYIKLNGKRFGGESYYIDSLQMGDILLRNVPATVIAGNPSSHLPDSLKKHMLLLDSLMAKRPVIGLPLLAMLDNIKIEWDKSQIVLQQKGDMYNSHQAPNIFISSGMLYTTVQIGDNNFTVHLDTGSNTVLELSPIYYELFQTSNRLDSIGHVRHEIRFDSVSYYKFKFLNNADILFNNQRIDLQAEERALIKHISTYNDIYKDGIMGLPFLKQLGNKVIFDFVNMRLTAE